MHAAPLLALQFELRDRARRKLRDQGVEPLAQVEHAQQPNQRRQLAAMAGLDALERTLGDARLLGESRLGQVGFDALPLEPAAERLQDAASVRSK